MKYFTTTIAVLIIILHTSFRLFSQNVGINPNGNLPDPSAGLHVDFTDKGFLLPKMSMAQRNAIVNPAIGLQVYNTTTNCLEIFFNGFWKNVVCECSAPPVAPISIQGAQTVCVNQTGVQYSVQLQANVVSYTWSSSNSNDVITGNGSNAITIDFSGSGVRTLSVMAVNACGNSIATTLSVNSTNPLASFTPLAVSVNSMVTFTPISYSGASYTWTFDQGSPSTATVQNPTTTWTNTGNFDVTLHVAVNSNCSVTNTTQVLVTNCIPTVITYNFSNCGNNTGKLGPTQTQCNAIYSSTNLNNLVTVNSGIQEFNILSTGNYKIEVAGAKGGNASSYQGGSGAKITGQMILNNGDNLKILVGQMGENTSYAGGGGASAVWMNSTPLIVAGGGGGGNSITNPQTGLNGATTTAGVSSFAAGGINGNGGASISQTQSGAGFYGNGTMGSGSVVPIALVNGGNGGHGYNPYWGGFGGGGAGFGGGGGGGGYSGGGSGRYTDIKSAGGGGGSYIQPNAYNIETSNGLYENSGVFNNGTINNLNSYNNSHGYVIITKYCL